MWSDSKGRSCWAAREREIHIATLHTREAEICNARGYAPDIARAALATVVPLLALAAAQPDGSQEQRDDLQRALDRALWGAELVQREKLGQEASPVLVSAWVAAGDWDRAIAECEVVDLDTDSCATAYYLRFAAQHRPEDRAKLVAALESRRPVAKTRESKVGCLPSDASDAFRIALLADLAGDPDLARSQLAWMLMQCEPGAITPGMLDVFPTWFVSDD